MKFSQRYGARPRHLIAIMVAFVVIGVAGFHWLAHGADGMDTIKWFAVSAVTVEVVLIPAGLLIARVSPTVLRVPLLLSGLLLLVSLPLVLRLGNGTFRATTGLSASVYLWHWLMASAVIFAGWGLLRIRRCWMGSAGD